MRLARACVPDGNPPQAAMRPSANPSGLYARKWPIVRDISSHLPVPTPVSSWRPAARAKHPPCSEWPTRSSWQRNLSKTMCGCSSKCCRASRTNVENVLADDGEQGVSRTGRDDELPDGQSPPAFRHDGKDRDAQKRPRAEADQRAQLFVSPRQQRAQQSAA